MDDENLFLIATKEVEGPEINEALWVKSIALAEGNKEIARYKYINLRVDQLKKNPGRIDRYDQQSSPKMAFKSSSGIKGGSLPDNTKINCSAVGCSDKKGKNGISKDAPHWKLLLIALLLGPLICLLIYTHDWMRYNSVEHLENEMFVMAATISVFLSLSVYAFLLYQGTTTGWRSVCAAISLFLLFIKFRYNPEFSFLDFSTNGIGASIGTLIGILGLPPLLVLAPRQAVSWIRRT